MTPKKIIPILLMAMCITLVTPAFAKETSAGNTEVPKEVRALQMENRLIEIRNMAKTNLTNAQKRELRQEVKSIRRERRRRGIFLSVGAIIIIILLLILLI
ncbi:MAG TPA: hypothetical protein VFI29_02145 [Hanamia sp.]|nr:hypothetical protein [Hanamia sp.]